MTKYNLADVQADIGKAVRYLFQHFPRPKLGPGWVKVRDKIRKQQANGVKTLSRKAFNALCTKGVSNTGVLLKFLHESGVVFYQENLFSGQIILDQQWAVDAIYTVCDRQRTLPHLMGDGKFTRDHLKLLAWQQFSDDEQRLFLNMMESCGICFRTKRLNPGKNPAEYENIAPDWLPGFEARATLHSREKTPGDAEATARFRFLHDGVVRSLLAKVGNQFGDNAIYWKYGFWFPSEESEVLAQVTWDAPESSSLEGKISLKAWGPNAEKLISAVLNTLEQVNIGSKPKITRTSKKRDDAAKPRIREGRGVEELPVGGRPKTTDDRRVFISYAWGDQSKDGQRREKLVIELVRALESWGYEPLYDKERLRPGDVISQYMTLAGESAKVVAILSTKYLEESAFCLTEIYNAYLSCQFKKEAFLRRVVSASLADVDYFSAKSRAAIAKKWAMKYAEFKDIDFDYVACDDFAEWKQMKLWAALLPEMLKAISDTIHSVGFEAIAKDGFAAIKEMLQKPR